MINILELESSKGWGGQEKRTVRVVNGLDKSRFRVFYGVHKDSELMKHKEQIDAIMLELPISKSYNLIELYKVIKAVKKYKINIISTHSSKDAWIGAIAGKLTGVKVIRVRHLQLSINSPLSYNLSSRVTAVCNSVKEHLVSRGVKSEKIDVIYSGRDMSLYTPDIIYNLRSEIDAQNDEILIGIVAVLRAQKRHTLLLEALAKLPANCKVVIIGEGPQDANIRIAIKELGVEKRVYMLGHREDVAQILPSLDIFVLPSIMEAIGGSAIEASACG
ncbi:MAG: glycosyltransferase, partial [Campylobacterales bacterium]